MSIRLFPVLRGGGWEGQPLFVPWHMMSLHEGQAKINHCWQDLNRLASRGGCSMLEIYYICHDMDFPSYREDTVSYATVNEWISTILEEYGLGEDGIDRRLEL